MKAAKLWLAQTAIGEPGTKASDLCAGLGTTRQTLYSPTAHMPQEIAFATKPHLARTMVERAIAAGVPFAWVVSDSIYGVSEVEKALRRAGKGYVLGVNATSQFNSWGAKPPVAGTAAAIAGALNPSAWHRLSAGAGAKGERLFDWAYLELADLAAAEYNQSLSGLWTRGLLIRRNIADGELAFFATWCP